MDAVGGEGLMDQVILHDAPVRVEILYSNEYENEGKEEEEEAERERR